MLTVNYIEGNLIKQAVELRYNAIAHGCNCFGKMGKGVAYSLRNVVPEAYAKDLQTVLGDRNKLGTFSMVKSQFGFYVFNLYTQFNYSNYYKVVDHDAVDSAIRLMIDTLLTLIPEGPITIGIPYIGANNAGGTKEELIAVLDKLKEDFLSDREVTISVVNYRPR